MKPYLNISKLIAHLGGRSRVAGALQDLGFGLFSPKTIDSWMMRGRISSDHLAALLVVAANEKRPIRDLYPYIIKPQGEKR